MPTRRTSWNGWTEWQLEHPADEGDTLSESLVTSIPGLTRVGDLHLEISTSRCRLTGSAQLAGKPITWRASGRDLAGTLDELRRHLRRMAAAFRGEHPTD
jgi:hypothetical protein